MPRTPEQEVIRLTRQNATLTEQNRNLQSDVDTRLSNQRNSGRIEGGVVGGISGLVLGAALIFGAGAVAKDGTPRPTGTPRPPETPAGLVTPSPEGTATAAPATEAPETQAPASEEPTATPDGDQESQAPVEGSWVAVPATLKEIEVKGLEGGATAEDGTVFPEFEEGKWFHPLYDRFQVDPSKDQWRGVGPWYPVEFKNLDENAALLSTHGNVGELIVVSDQGGWVEVGFWQLDNYQDDGAWGRGPDGIGDIYQDGSWAMQYTFKELGANAEVLVIDPDTGNPYTWEDGSPVIYRANDKGTASFEIPQTNGNDVRVAFRFQMPFASEAVQPHEVKIERGPNDRPRRTGENLLPESVLKPEVPLE